MLGFVSYDDTSEGNPTGDPFSDEIEEEELRMTRFLVKTDSLPSFLVERVGVQGNGGIQNPKTRNLLNIFAFEGMGYENIWQRVDSVSEKERANLGTYWSSTDALDRKIFADGWEEIMEIEPFLRLLEVKGHGRSVLDKILRDSLTISSGPGKSDLEKIQMVEFQPRSDIASRIERTQPQLGTQKIVEEGFVEHIFDERNELEVPSLSNFTTLNAQAWKQMESLLRLAGRVAFSIGIHQWYKISSTTTTRRNVRFERGNFSSRWKLTDFSEDFGDGNESSFNLVNIRIMEPKLFLFGLKFYNRGNTVKDAIPVEETDFGSDKQFFDRLGQVCMRERLKTGILCYTLEVPKLVRLFIRNGETSARSELGTYMSLIRAFATEIVDKTDFKRSLRDNGFVCMRNMKPSRDPLQIGIHLAVHWRRREIDTERFSPETVTSDHKVASMEGDGTLQKKSTSLEGTQSQSNEIVVLSMNTNKSEQIGTEKSKISAESTSKHTLEPPPSTQIHQLDEADDAIINESNQDIGVEDAKSPENEDMCQILSASQSRESGDTFRKRKRESADEDDTQKEHLAKRSMQDSLDEYVSLHRQGGVNVSGESLGKKSFRIVDPPNTVVHSDLRDFASSSIAKSVFITAPPDFPTKHFVHTILYSASLSTSPDASTANQTRILAVFSDRNGAESFQKFIEAAGDSQLERNMELVTGDGDAANLRRKTVILTQESAIHRDASLTQDFRIIIFPEVENLSAILKAVEAASDEQTIFIGMSKQAVSPQPLFRYGLSHQALSAMDVSPFARYERIVVDLDERSASLAVYLSEAGETITKSLMETSDVHYTLSFETMNVEYVKGVFASVAAKLKAASSEGMTHVLEAAKSAYRNAATLLLLQNTRVALIDGGVVSAVEVLHRTMDNPAHRKALVDEIATRVLSKAEGELRDDNGGYKYSVLANNLLREEVDCTALVICAQRTSCSVCCDILEQAGISSSIADSKDWKQKEGEVVIMESPLGKVEERLRDVPIHNFRTLVFFSSFLKKFEDLPSYSLFCKGWLRIIEIVESGVAQTKPPTIQVVSSLFTESEDVGMGEEHVSTSRNEKGERGQEVWKEELHNLKDEGVNTTIVIGDDMRENGLDIISGLRRFGNGTLSLVERSGPAIPSLIIGGSKAIVLVSTELLLGSADGGKKDSRSLKGGKTQGGLKDLIGRISRHALAYDDVYVVLELYSSPQAEGSSITTYLSDLISSVQHFRSPVTVMYSSGKKETLEVLLCLVAEEKGAETQYSEEEETYHERMLLRAPFVSVPSVISVLRSHTLHDIITRDIEDLEIPGEFEASIRTLKMLLNKNFTEAQENDWELLSGSTPSTNTTVKRKMSRTDAGIGIQVGSRNDNKTSVDSGSGGGKEHYQEEEIRHKSFRMKQTILDQFKYDPAAEKPLSFVKSARPRPTYRATGFDLSADSTFHVPKRRKFFRLDKNIQGGGDKEMQAQGRAGLNREHHQVQSKKSSLQLSRKNTTRGKPFFTRIQTPEDVLNTPLLQRTPTESKFSSISSKKVWIGNSSSSSLHTREQQRWNTGRQYREQYQQEQEPNVKKGSRNGNKDDGLYSSWAQFVDREGRNEAKSSETYERRTEEQISSRIPRYGKKTYF